MSFDTDHAIAETLRHIQKATQADSAVLMPILRHSQTLIQPVYCAGMEIVLTEQNMLSLVVSSLMKEAAATRRVACHYPGDDGDTWPSAVIVFPLSFSDELCGSLILVWNDAADHTPDFAAAELGASTLTPLVAGALSFDANRYYVQALEYLGGLPTEFNLLNTLDEILHAAGHTACVLLDCEHYAFFVATPDNVTAALSEGSDPDFMDVVQDYELPSYMFQLEDLPYNQQHTLLISAQNTENIPPEWIAYFKDNGVHACIAAIVHSNQEILGTMWLFYHRPYVPSTFDSQLAEILASQLAAAIQNIELITANRHQAEVLEQRVKERTKELARALEQAKSADRLKTQLLSTVSHELRTPLAVIKAHTSTELVYYDRLPKERHVQFLTTVNEETDRLTNLINSLLDLSRLEAGALDIRPSAFEPVALLEQLIHLLQSRFPDRTITTKLPPPQKPIMADPVRLEQLLGNLVENAVKFSPPTAPIEIGARAWEDALEFWVKDQGQGLTQDQARHVFESFYKSTDLLHHKSGSGVGLGLAICKGLAEGMGGRIWCETAGLNKGSRFAFTLPWASIQPS